MAPIKSNDDIDWLPGLGKLSQNASESVFAPGIKLGTGLNTQTANPEFDEVQYSIVCSDCSKHFWSRSRADCHAALTGHVLRKPIKSPLVPNSLAVDSETLSTLAMGAKARPNIEMLDGEDSEHSGNEEYLTSFGYGKQPSGHEAANERAKIEHMQNMDSVASNVHDGFSTSATVNSGLNSSFHAAGSSIYPNSAYWSAKPLGPSLRKPLSPSHRAMYPTLLDWSTEQSAPSAIFPTYPVYERGVSMASTYGTTSPTNGHAKLLFQDQAVVPESEYETSQSEKEDNLSRSPRVSPSLSSSGLPSIQEDPHSTDSDNQAILTPTMSDSRFPNSSAATLEHRLVIFPHDLSDRVFFIVTSSGSREGPGFIMGLAEAQNAVTFRDGVHNRVKSLGEQVGLREIVAHLPWLPVPVYADSSEDHYQMLRMVRSWPDWQNTNWNACCHVFVTVEDEKAGKGEGEQETPGTHEDL